MSAFPVRSRVVGLGRMSQEEFGRSFVMQAAGTGVGVQRSYLPNTGAILMGVSQKESAANFEKELKQEVIKEAVVEMAVTTAISFIPIIGPIISLAISGASMINQAKAKREIAKAKHQSEALGTMVDFYVEMKKNELINKLDAVYRRAYREAVPLALSYQPLTIESEQEVMRRVFNQETMTKGPLAPPSEEELKAEAERDLAQVRRKLDVKVDDAKAAEPVNGLGWGAMGSVAGYITQQANRQAMMRIMEINRQINPIMERVSQPAFQAFLAKKLAIGMRQNPNFMAVAEAMGAPAPTKFIGVGEPTSGSRPIPSTGEASDVGLPSANPTRKIATAQAKPIPSGIPKGDAPAPDVEPASNAKRNLLFAGAAVAGAMLLLR